MKKKRLNLDKVMVYQSQDSIFIIVFGGIASVFCVISMAISITTLVLLCKKKYRKNIIHKCNIIIYCNFIFLLSKALINLIEVFKNQDLTKNLFICRFSYFCVNYFIILLTVMLMLMAIYRYIAAIHPFYFQKIREFVGLHIFILTIFTISIHLPSTLKISNFKNNENKTVFVFELF